MKFSAFTKVGIIRILSVSLMLSVYISVVLINYASGELTAGNLFATLFFVAAMIVFSVFAKMKEHPPLLYGVRGWLIASAFICLLAIIFSAANAEFSGSFNELIGYAVMLLISPYFGFFYMIDSDVAVGLLGAAISILCLFIPTWVTRISERRRLTKKYR